MTCVFFMSLKLFYVCDLFCYCYLTRLINFLVGMKGKEPMAIGGPWSPSLDGNHPGEDPRVLINTAIRTTRALTGIDLAGVTQWWV